MLMLPTKIYFAKIKSRLNNKFVLLWWVCKAKIDYNFVNLRARKRKIYRKIYKTYYKLLYKRFKKLSSNLINYLNDKLVLIKNIIHPLFLIKKYIKKVIRIKKKQLLRLRRRKIKKIIMLHQSLYQEIISFKNNLRNKLKKIIQRISRKKISMNNHSPLFKKSSKTKSNVRKLINIKTIVAIALLILIGYLVYKGQMNSSSNASKSTSKLSNITNIKSEAILGKSKKDHANRLPEDQKIKSSQESNKKIDSHTDTAASSAVIDAGSPTTPPITIEPSPPIYVLVNAREGTTYSSETSATISAMPSREGDSFTQGSILVEFDCRVQQAELKKAIAQKKFADNNYKSSKKLKSYDSISGSELIKSQAESEIANAEVDKLQAVVSKCIIKAPYNGSVSDTMANVGETVKPGDPLIKIVNNENLELHLQIPSIWLRWLHVGTEFDFNVNELNKVFVAKVTKINPEINAVSQTVKIIGSLKTPEPSLLPGMSGTAVFQKMQKRENINSENTKFIDPEKNKIIKTDNNNDPNDPKGLS